MRSTKHHPAETLAAATKIQEAATRLVLLSREAETEILTIAIENILEAIHELENIITPDKAEAQRAPRA